MAKVRHIQSALNAGEIAPRLRGRTDIPRYANGLETSRNAIPMVEGGAFRIPGSRHVAAASGPVVRLVPFAEATGGTLTGWMLEFGDGVLRFYTGGAQVLDNGAPLELATPYGAADLAGLTHGQSENTLYLWHGSHHPRRLVRSGGAWTLEQLPVSVYPYQRPPGTDGITITPSAISGAVTLTASADLFQAGHVGTIFDINGGLASITGYTSPTVATGTMIQPIAVPAEIRKYTDTITVTIVKASLPAGVSVVTVTSVGQKDATSAQSTTVDLSQDVTVTTDPLPTGVTAATTTTYNLVESMERHTTTVTLTIDKDTLAGDTAVAITATSQRNVLRSPRAKTDTVSYKLTTTAAPSPLPTGVTVAIAQAVTPITGTEADGEWTELAWSPLRGYPQCGAFFEQRLLMAASATYPTIVWGSKTGKPLDFTTGTLDDDGFSFPVAAAATAIHHLTTINRVFLFSHDREITIDSGDKPLTPTTPTIKARGANGSSARVAPLQIGSQIYFVSRSGKRLCTLEYDLGVDDYIASDLSVFGSHMTAGGGIISMAHTREPHSVLWCVTADGRLVTVTVDKRQEVTAWASHGSGAAHRYLDLAVMPGGVDSDIVWTAVERTVGGFPQTCIEYLDPGLNTCSAVTATSPVPQTVWAGLDHLEGETVDIVADGFVAPPQRVSAGTVTLAHAATAVEAGLNYVTVIKDLPVELAQMGTTAQGSNMAVSRITVRLLESSGCTVNGQAVPFRSFGPGALDSPLVPFTGDKTVVGLGRGARPEDSQVTIIQDKPLPLTVLAIIKQVAIND